HVAQALTRLGYPPASMTALGLDARRSALFEAVLGGGRRLFIKVLTHERRDRDLLYRMWWFTTHLRHPNTPPPGRDSLEHEALMMMQAAGAGVQVPAVVTFGGYGHGTGILVQEWVDG